MKNSALALILLLASLAQAQGLMDISNSIFPTFGNEFTFTSEELIKAFGDRKIDDPSSPLQFELMKRFAQRIQSECINCKINEIKDRFNELAYRVTLPTGFSFMIMADPFVIEVVTDPQTLKQGQNNANDIQKLIFSSAQFIGLSPHEDKGGGHIHIGIKSAFAHNPKAFRNFVVDLMNHSDVFKSLGAMAKNATVISELGEASVEEFKKVIVEFDLQLSRDLSWQNDATKGQILIEHLAAEINKRVYTSHPKGMNPTRYQAMNFQRMVGELFSVDAKTLELRFFRAQKNSREFVSLLKILYQRIQQAHDEQGLVKVDIKNSKKLSLTEKVKRTRDFILIPGVKWQDIKTAVFDQDVARALGSRLCADSAAHTTK